MFTRAGIWVFFYTAQPAPGMEPVFEHWLEMATNADNLDLAAITGLGNLHSSEACAALRRIAQTRDTANRYIQEPAAVALAQPNGCADGALSAGQPLRLSDIDFVRIAPGTFQMGDQTGHGASFERPVHAVTLTHGFWMQRTPVTQAQWQAVMGNNPSELHRATGPGGQLRYLACADCPVDHVTYEDVQIFIVKLDSMTGHRYRLPTEAEWEYAARAGTTADYGVPGAVGAGAWTAENSDGTTHPVAQLQPNAWGLYDMEGNVAEFVSDWFGSYPDTAVTDPTGPRSGPDYPGMINPRPAGAGRVLRGGAWDYDASSARSASRAYFVPPGYQHPTFVGFRLVRAD